MDSRRDQNIQSDTTSVLVVAAAKFDTKSSVSSANSQQFQS